MAHCKLPEYRVVRSKRRSIVLIVKENGILEVRCPRAVSVRQIESIVSSRSEWINRQLLKSAKLIKLPDLTELSQFEVGVHKRKLIERIDTYMREYDGPIPAGFTIKQQRTRWGSCSSRRNINLNLKSLYLPDDLFSYLLEHELAHLVHMNHSLDFWKYLENRIPDARIRRKKLQKYSLR